MKHIEDEHGCVHPCNTCIALFTVCGAASATFVWLILIVIGVVSL